MISPIRWLKESEAVRQHLAKEFNMERSGGREIAGGELVSDGFRPDDLYRTFTAKNLQEYTGEKSEDVYKLFDRAVDKAKAEMANIDTTNEKPISEKNASANQSNGQDDAGTAKKGKGRRGRPKKEV